MYSAKFRKSPAWHLISSHIKSCTQWKFKEYPRGDFDIAVPLNDDGRGQGQLFINIIPVSELEKCFENDELMFDNVVLPDFKLVIVLLDDLKGEEEGGDNHGSEKNDGFIALSKIQMRQIQKPFSAPTLMVHKSENVLPLLKTYIENLKGPVDVVKLPSVESLIASATTRGGGQFLSKAEVEAVVNICPSVRELEEATRTVDGRVMLEQYLGQQTAREMIRFWEDDWIA